MISFKERQQPCLLCETLLVRNEERERWERRWKPTRDLLQPSQWVIMEWARATTAQVHTVQFTLTTPACFLLHWYLYLGSKVTSRKFSRVEKRTDAWVSWCLLNCISFYTLTFTLPLLTLTCFLSWNTAQCHTHTFLCQLFFLSGNT